MAPDTVPPIPFLVAVDTFGGKKYGSVVMPETPASAKSTAHLTAVVPTPTAPRIAIYSGAIIPISGVFSRLVVVDIPIAPVSVTKILVDSPFTVIT